MVTLYLPLVDDAAAVPPPLQIIRQVKVASSLLFSLRLRPFSSDMFLCPALHVTVTTKSERERFHEDELSFLPRESENDCFSRV